MRSNTHKCRKLELRQKQAIRTPFPEEHLWTAASGYSEGDALWYFQLPDMSYDDRNMVNERVSTTVLQIYLIWTPAQILEHAIEFQGGPKTPASPKTEVSVTLVDGWRLQINNTTKIFILDVATILDMSLWNNY